MIDRNAYRVVSDLGGLRFVAANFENQVFEKHFHEEYVLGINIRGAHDFYFNRQIYTAGNEEVVVIPPGELHTGLAHKNGDWEYLAIYPDLSTLKNLTGMNEIRCAFAGYPSITQPDAIEIFKKAMFALLSGQAIEAEDFLIQFLQLANYDSLLQPKAVRRKQVPYLVTSIQQYLEDQPERVIRLDDLQEQFDLSKYHIVRLFRAFTGVSPIQYHRFIRLSRSLNDLMVGRDIVNTALKYCFYDQSHFSNAFKRTYGFTPNQLLKST